MAEKGDEAKLVAMIEAKVVNINAVDVSSLRSALHLAAMGGHLPCLKVLLDNGWMSWLTQRTRCVLQVSVR